jgi:hypothetical protein
VIPEQLEEVAGEDGQQKATARSAATRGERSGEKRKDIDIEVCGLHID